MRTAVRLHVGLQKAFITGALHVDQVWHGRHFLNPPKAFADALAPGKRPVDRVHGLSCLKLRSVMLPREMPPGETPVVRILKMVILIERAQSSSEAQDATSRWADPDG